MGVYGADNLKYHTKIDGGEGRREMEDKFLIFQKTFNMHIPG